METVVAIRESIRHLVSNSYSVVALICVGILVIQVTCSRLEWRRRRIEAERYRRNHFV